MFCAYLIEVHRIQSSTLKSYISVIKFTLKDDGYKWVDNEVWLNSLTRSCHLINDRMATRLPIQFNLFELLLFEVRHSLGRSQPYLEKMYLALFSLSYYGLLRIGEVTHSEHNILASNIHVATNKQKILILMYSSKTLNLGGQQHQIKISTSEASGRKKKFFCPLSILREFISTRGNIYDNHEPFFAFADKSPVQAHMARKLLQDLLNKLHIDGSLYDFHSFRSGRSLDLLKYRFSVKAIKRLGRWKLNVVYRYLKPLYA